MQDQETITKITDELQAAINEICLLDQSAATSKRVAKAVQHISIARLRLIELRHDVFRKTGEWIEPVECLNGN